MARITQIEKDGTTYELGKEIVVDQATNANSENPVSNKAVTAAVNTLTESVATAQTTANSAKTKADTAVQSATFAGTAMTKSGTAVSIAQSAARTALGLGTAAYQSSSAFDGAGAAESRVTTHNSSASAHSDIRSNITALAEKVSGRATAYVFKNKSDAAYTAAIGKTGSFLIGDTVYFTDTGMQDQWVTAVKTTSPYYTFADIETEHPDLSGYAQASGTLTGDKIVLGGGSKTVKASTRSVFDSYASAGTTDVLSKSATDGLIQSKGYQTAANVNSLINAANKQDEATVTANADGTYTLVL